MSQPITATLRLAAAIVAMLGICLSAGCQPPSDAPGSVLNRGVGPEPETLDPQLARTLQAQHVLRDLFECLTSYSPAGELVPGAAASWEISDDGMAYVFSLRPEARWSNGDGVTAADFVAAFRRLVDPATAAFYAETLAPVRNAPEIVAGDLPRQRRLAGCARRRVRQAGQPGLERRLSSRVLGPRLGNHAQPQPLLLERRGDPHRNRTAPCDRGTQRRVVPLPRGRTGRNQ